MCTGSDTRLVQIGIECCCGREEETPHTHDHEAELIEGLRMNSPHGEASREASDRQQGAVHTIGPDRR